MPTSCNTLAIISVIAHPAESIPVEASSLLLRYHAAALDPISTKTPSATPAGSTLMSASWLGLPMPGPYQKAKSNQQDRGDRLIGAVDDQGVIGHGVEHVEDE